MFGPDICGSTRRTHLIFNYKGQNLLIKNDISTETDQLTHVYKLILKPDNTYQVYIDNRLSSDGSLEENWDFLKPKEIKDPSKSKPTDWVDDRTIPDPTDVKPDGYDDVPEQVKYIYNIMVEKMHLFDFDTILCRSLIPMPRNQKIGTKMTTVNGR